MNEQKYNSERAVVQLVQINQAYLQQQYLPYVAGLMQAYALRHAKAVQRYTFLAPIFQRGSPELQAAEARYADIIGFSTYVWNMQYSLHLAQHLKAESPQCLIIFGGPQVPDHAEDFLRAHDFIDVVVHGEGEATFLALLECWPERQWQHIPGLSWLDSNGVFHHQEKAARMRGLDDIPSPYLSGIYAPLLKAYPDERWLVLWETNRGCPFSCAYCDWGSATASRVNRFSEDRLKAEIQWFGKHKIHTVYCCDANYGLLPRDVALTDSLVTEHQKSSYPRVFYIQNTKNVTERAYLIQQKISQAGLNQAVTLSLQSVTPEVLEAIQRQNISLESYRELQHRFRANDVLTYTDMLVGLPGETFESFVHSVDQVIEEGQHHLIRFYNVYILPNAPMAQPDYRKKYALKTVTTLYAEPFAKVQSPIVEYQEMLIASNSLSASDWSRCRTFAWWAELLYFNRKIVQLPILLLRQLAEISFADSLCFYLEGQWPKTTVLQQIRQFFSDHCVAIQNGESELCRLSVSGQGEIWMIVEDYLFSGLSQSAAWPVFFQEQALVLQALLAERQRLDLWPVISEALTLSACLLPAQISQQPFELQVSSNFWTVYTAALKGDDLALMKGPQNLIFDGSGSPYQSLRTEAIQGVKIQQDLAKG